MTVDVERNAADCRDDLPVMRWRASSALADAVATDAVADETAVALSYNGIAHVVMMMTPADLSDFALGFSLSEGIVDAPDEIHGCEILPRADGVEVALTVSARRFAALKERRRNLVGRTGCGLCGAESLEQALRPATRVPRTLHVAADAIERACAGLGARQPLAAETGATHAAAWCEADGAIVLVREDVGRHNALDKLIGALAASGSRQPGFALVSSRASYEMVTKTARAGIELLVAVSAPTTLAVRLAQEAELTLVGFARDGRFSVYAVPERIALQTGTNT